MFRKYRESIDNNRIKFTLIVEFDSDLRAHIKLDPISSDKSVEKAARHMIINNFLEKKKRLIQNLSLRESCNNCN